MRTDVTALDADVVRFRQFNRMYTHFIGVLDEELLQSDYNLIEARVLYELANGGHRSAKDIVDALGVDAGYLSRILKRFEKTGVLRRTPSKADSRSAELTLTSEGRAQFRKLNALSDNQALDLLRPLGGLDRLDLTAAMGQIQRILKAPAGGGCVLREPRAGDLGWVIHREAAVYAQEYGFDHTYEALVASIVAEFARDFDAKRERCWIADVDGQNVGHIFLVKHKERKNTARLRLLLVEPSARGLHVGTMLVEECVRFAREAGYRRITLWTQKDLTAAHRIYIKTGFEMVGESPHRSFGKDLVAQTWEMQLRDREGFTAASR